MADNTPAARTGPPRSLSFATASLSFPAHFADKEDQEFRGAFEYPSYGQKGKSRRDLGKPSTEEIRNPKIWFHDSPRNEFDEIQAMDSPLSEPGSSANALPRSLSRDSPATVRNSYKTALRRAFSAPHHTTETPSDNGKQKEENKERERDASQGSAKWAKLRSLLPHIVYHNQSIVPGPSVIASHAVNITDELITGGLSTLMLRLWLERDEKGRRRVPVLLHRLRFRISDSIHPLQRQRSVFRIECEYANGAARWVIYRELRDFVSLHAHYTVSNVYNRIREELPEFPKTSTCLIFISLFLLTWSLFFLGLPYLKFLKKGGARVSRADFARMQREALENYLINLIRTVVSHVLSRNFVYIRPTPLSPDVSPFFKSTRWIP
jgi:phospholipase D1/2